ncbi:hypothetical protein JAAARDRAFT_37020 [Jaapia argillacea MUCL 33604]|uniref:F-box domain-containing protein n=1 Tax=Jaapia argillacea MUCL 33604 TaxID=933084 RepID=A0A067PP72_9AGAM|nr:hypothetical protein JAAARDRAFT_37020 [Jaapia argillacea MUCL 33604]
MFPVELWAIIFKFVQSPRDLSQICSISRTFRREATPRLYHSVVLSSGWDQLLAFSRVVTREGKRVARLSIGIHGNLDRCRILVEQKQLLRAILRALPNLRFLDLSAATPHSIDCCFASSMSTMFGGCQFQLEEFRNSVITFDHTIDFLATQSSLRSWEHLPESLSHRVRRFDESFLPAISSVDIDTDLLIRCFSIARPIERMHLRIGGGQEEVFFLDLIQAVGLFGPSLTTLSLDGTLCSSGTVTALASGLAEGFLPHLVHLSLKDDYLTEDDDFLEDYPVDFSTGLCELCDCIAHFKTLETFVFSPPHLTGDPSWWSMGVSSRALAQVVARAIFASCASLRLVALPAGARSSFEIASPEFVTYTRGSDGDAHETTEETLNLNSWKTLS